ncbi:hypothetical protein Q7I20_19645 [Aeromonas veronii]
MEHRIGLKGVNMIELGFFLAALLERTGICVLGSQNLAAQVDGAGNRR